MISNNYFRIVLTLFSFMKLEPFGLAMNAWKRSKWELVMVGKWTFRHEKITCQQQIMYVENFTQLTWYAAWSTAFQENGAPTSFRKETTRWTAFGSKGPRLSCKLQSCELMQWYVNFRVILCKGCGLEAGSIVVVWGSSAKLFRAALSVLQCNFSFPLRRYHFSPVAGYLGFLANVINSVSW